MFTIRPPHILQAQSKLQIILNMESTNGILHTLDTPRLGVTDISYLSFGTEQSWMTINIVDICVVL